MKKRSSVILFLSLLLSVSVFADKGKKGKDKEKADSAAAEIINYLTLMDSVNKAMHYQSGLVKLKGDFATLNIPKDFKFLNAEQAQFVLHKVWGNPEREDVLGMIFPADADPFTDSSFAFVISFDDMGYVKDDDASKLKYDDLLKQMRDDEAESNKARSAAGYEPIHLVGWAQQPFYDEKNKVLHWAKELQFGTEDNGSHTLNYDVRVLGRKGVLSLNAVASMSELPLVKKNIDAILKMSSYTEGNAYKDYSSGTDKIAAYTIGGLVAGKILAKVGFLALILKAWKLIFAGIMVVFYAVKKFFTGKGRKEEEYVVSTEPASPVDETPAAELPASTEATTTETTVADSEHHS